MFRVVLPPIIRSASNCIYSIWYLSHRHCYLPLSWKSWNWFECAVGGVSHPQHTQTSVCLRWVRSCKVETIQRMLQCLKFQFLKVFKSVGSVCIRNGRGLASGSFPMLNAYATIFETLAPLTDNPLWHDTVPILHWHHSVHFDTWHTFSPQIWITALCSFWCKWNWECPCLWHKTHDRNRLSRSHMHHDSGRGVDHVYFVMPNQQYSQVQNMYL